MARELVKVFAPASVGNVAVGYDVLGFAIHGIGDEVVLKKGKERGLQIVGIHGDNKRLPKAVEKNTAGVAALSLLKDLGAEDLPLEMTIHKKMPFGSGLGSSAASAVAGVYAVHELLKTGLTKSALLKHAVRGEQIADGAWHADNVAPSLLGGMVFIRDNQTLDVHKIYCPEGLKAVVIYPHVEVLTKDSRDILKPTISLEKHIVQSGNLGGFIIGMQKSDFGLIKRSLEDVIIEPQRAHLIPYFYKMKEQALKFGALGFSISGAGPSMFALCDHSLAAENIKEAALKLYLDHGVNVDVYLSDINQEGAMMY